MTQTLIFDHDDVNVSSPSYLYGREMLLELSIQFQHVQESVCIVRRMLSSSFCKMWFIMRKFSFRQSLESRLTWAASADLFFNQQLFFFRIFDEILNSENVFHAPKSSHPKKLCHYHHWIQKIQF